MGKPPPGIGDSRTNQRAVPPLSAARMGSQPKPGLLALKPAIKSVPTTHRVSATPLGPPVYRPTVQRASSTHRKISPAYPHPASVIQPSKYVPPSMRGAAPSSGSAYRPPGKAGDLVAWLAATPNLQVYRVFPIKDNGDQVVELGQRINIDGAFRCVRYNIHRADTAKPILGSIWMEGIRNVSVNAQDNPKRATLVQIWRAALNPPAPAPAPEIDIAGFFD